MVRTGRVSRAFLIAAAALALCSARTEYEITVTNLTYMQPFSSIILVAHTDDIEVFEVGAASSEEFRLLAETGNASALQSSFGAEVNECCLCGLEVGSVELEPGDMLTMTISVDDNVCSDGVLFSMAGMLLNTNDGFFGIASMAPDVEGSVFHAPAFDAGTEQNNELCSHIPGPACEASTGNLQAEPGEGFIHSHLGFRGIGGELAAEVFDWNNPVA